MKNAPYVTGIAGKWGLGEPDTPSVPNRRGVDEWLGYLSQRRAHSHQPPYLGSNEQESILAETRRDANFVEKILAFEVLSP